MTTDNKHVHVKWLALAIMVVGLQLVAYKTYSANLRYQTDFEKLELASLKSGHELRKHEDLLGARQNELADTIDELRKELAESNQKLDNIQRDLRAKESAKQRPYNPHVDDWDRNDD